jgi:membrane protease YdiL (CAAX protease family)
LTPPIPDFLTEPHRPWRAVLLGWPTVTLPALGLSLVAAAIFGKAGQPSFPMDGLGALFLLVIFAPFFETLIMAAVLEVLRRFLSPWAAALISGIGWGVAHSLQAAAWGLVIWWVFLILSRLYLTWRERSIWLALAIPFAVHALNNFLPALAVAFR